MRKKILVPTDFSETAFNAALYACQIAEKNDFDIHLFHCYTSSTAVGGKDNDIPTGDVQIEEVKNQLLSSFSTVSISTECVARLLVDVLPDYAIPSNFEFVVMGTQGANKSKAVIWGSNTAYITSKVRIPVIAIPNAYSFNTKRVAILTNFKAEELESLQNFTHCCGAIDRLDIIHIYKAPNKSKEILNQLEDWAFNIKQLNNIHKVDIIAEPIQLENQELDTIPEVINQIISTNEYDSIIVTKTRKSFFNRIINTSVSKKIVLTLQKPTFFDKIN